MRFDAFQQMRMGQHMKLAPQMIQSMEILQMNLAELSERIEQELESNATLEIAEPEGDAQAGAGEQAEDAPERETEGDTLGEDGADDDFTPTLDGGETTSEEREPTMGDASGQEDFERLEAFEQENPDAAENNFDDRVSEREYEAPATPGEAGEDAKSQAMASAPSRDASIGEQLLEQWGLVDVRPELRAPGAWIIGFIEDDGYLRTPLETIIERAPAQLREPATGAPERFARALQAVQLMLEPAGLGARDTRECLLLQIDARAPEADEREERAWSLARAIVDAHLDDLKNNRLPRIAARLGVETDEVKRALLKLRQLRLNPGRELTSQSAPGIVPDAIVQYDPDRDRYYAYINDRRLPNLRINEEYARLAKDKGAPKPTREFLKVNLGNAQFLLDAIAQRNRTLLRVLEAVVDAQRDFFDYGPQAIRPLPMTKVAEQLGIHVATVSRAVAEKYIQTPRGVVALRRFFTGGTTTESGEEVSWEAIRSALLELIEQEDKASPLSDDALADQLKAKGFDIARRTVAKYRGQLNIPTGRLRKAH
jgi:RNA polymerase sigma-54 factor